MRGHAGHLEREILIEYASITRALSARWRMVLFLCGAPSRASRPAVWRGRCSGFPRALWRALARLPLQAGDEFAQRSRGRAQAARGSFGAVWRDRHMDV